MIFNLFKSKPTLKELIPNGFVDIHAHILPGIDDGAKNIEESIKLIDNMKEMGFAKIIGTPHTYPGLYDNTPDSIKKAFEVIHNLNIKNIKIEYATEYMIDNSLINKAKNKELFCLKDNYVLVEMSFISKPIGLYEILYEIKVNGYIPVLAHPERYLFMLNNFKEYFKLKKVGCLFQANFLALTEYYGKNVRRNLEKLINHNLIDFFGSDVHNLEHLNCFDYKIGYNKIDVLNEIVENNNIFK